MMAPQWWQNLTDTPGRWLDVVRRPWHGPHWWFRLWLRLPRPRYWRCNVRRRRALREHVEGHARALVASGEAWKVRVSRHQTNGASDLDGWAWGVVACTWRPPVHDMSSRELTWAEHCGARMLLGLVGGLAAELLRSDSAGAMLTQPAPAPGVRT